ncbi:MAG: Rrf2 family transcriptional regulator [Bacteroidales bacterium]
MWSKTTEYAIRALVQVAVCNIGGHRPGFREIAESIDAPVQFTAKILQTLSRAALVKSVRGRGGGFFFDSKSPELKLAEVIRTLEGDKYFTGCVVGLLKCDEDHPCPLHSEFTRIRGDLVTLAEQETIQGLARKTVEGDGRLRRN